MKLEKHFKGYRAKGTTTKENYKSKHKMIGPKGNNEFCSLRSIDGLEGAKLTFSFGTSHIPPNLENEPSCDNIIFSAPANKVYNYARSKFSKHCYLPLSCY